MSNGPPGPPDPPGPPGPPQAPDPPVDPRRQGRRFPEWPLATVLCGVALGLVLTLLNGWRLGAVLIGLSVLSGAGMRLLLPSRALGLLVVRSRGVDVAALLLAGVGIAVLALLVPPAQ